MDESSPVAEIEARFVDEVVACEARDALNAWFRWILQGSEDPQPAFFEPLGVDSAEYAWQLEEDVDWTLGPHARTLGPEVRIALSTQDTHLHLAGLLRRLGATAVRIVREDDA